MFQLHYRLAGSKINHCGLRLHDELKTSSDICTSNQKKKPLNLVLVYKHDLSRYYSTTCSTNFFNGILLNKLLDARLVTGYIVEELM